jgi:hypothetical protein
MSWEGEEGKMEKVGEEEWKRVEGKKERGCRM